MVKRLYQAVNFLRPLARLLFTMRRPAAVDILLRKPCFLARLILLGWKVLFICKSLFYVWLGPGVATASVPRQWYGETQACKWAVHSIKIQCCSAFIKWHFFSFFHNSSICHSRSSEIHGTGVLKGSLPP